MSGGLLALALGAAACGGSGSAANGSSSSSTGGGSAGGASGNTPGVTATTVTIGSHQPLTGIAAPGYSEIAPSSKAMFDYINANGGVNGRKIIYKYLDDQYNPSNTVTVVRQLVLQDNVFAIFDGLGTPTHEKVLSFLNSNKVPDVFVASGCSCWNDPSTYPYTFGWQPEYPVEGAVMGQYIAKNLKGHKIAYLYQNDDFGQGGVKGLDKYIPASMIVDKEPYDPLNTSPATAIGTAVAKMKAAGADTVVAFTVPAFTALMKLSMAKLGWNPQVWESNVGSDPVTLEHLMQSFAKQGGANLGSSVVGSLAAGIHTDSYLPPYGGGSTDPWIKLFTHVAQVEHLAYPIDGNVEYGMSVAWTFAQALKAAGKNLTRAGFVKAVETTTYQGAGLVRLAYSSTDHAGFQGVQLSTTTADGATLTGQPQDVNLQTLAITPSSYKEASPSAAGLLPASAIPSGG